MNEISVHCCLILTTEVSYFTKLRKYCEFYFTLKTKQYCLWNDTSTALFVTRIYFNSDYLMDKLTVAYRILTNALFSIVKVLLWYFYIFVIVKYSAFKEGLYLRVRNRGLARSQRKKRGWTTQFSHFLGNFLMEYYSYNCLRKLSPNPLWSSDKLSAD